MLWSKVVLWASLASAWTIKKAEVAVSGSGDVGERAPVSSFTSPLELYAGKSLDFAFKLGGANEEVSNVPHQAFIRLSSADSDNTQIDKIIPAKLRGSSAKVVVPYKQIPVQLHNHNLKASVLVSGHESESVEQDLLEVIVLGDNDEAPVDLRVNGFGRSLRNKPEIWHQFQLPPKHVNPIISFVFIAAIDVLFTLLLKGWSSHVGSLTTLPSSTTRLSLVGIIAAIETTFVLYYISWSIFSLITVLALLLPALFIVLNRA